jgi:hypothetical protein
LASRSRQRTREQLAGGIEPATVRVCVGDRDDEPDPPVIGLTSGREGVTLELRGSKLGLDVAEAALDLDVEDLVGSLENEVCGARVPRRDRNFEPDGPRWMGRRPDELGNGQLARVSERHRSHRIEAPAKLVTRRRRESTSELEGSPGHSPLGAADDRLGNPGTLGELRLRQTGGDPRDPELLSKSTEEPLSSSGSLGARQLPQIPHVQPA